MPGSVTQPQSLINRLPAGDNLGEAGTKPGRTRWLQLLSKNANQPGGSLGPKAYGGGALGRSSGAFAQAAMNRGIVLIESRPGAQTADIAINPSQPPTSMTVNFGSGATPGSAPLTSSLGQPVAYSGAGPKDITVSGATVGGVTQDYQGAARVTV